MSSLFVRYPTSGGIPTYANLAAFPSVANDGAAGIALDTDILYIYNAGSSTWIAVGGPGSVLTVGSIDSQTAAANGAVIAANQLVMQSASTTRPGLVNNTTQSFSGNKTFTGSISASNLSGTNTGDITLGTANGLSLSAQALSLGLSSTSTTGALSSTDWNTFNNKQSALTLGDLTDAGTDGIVVTGGVGAVVGSGTSIAQHVADATHNGYLSSTDWSTFNSKQAAGNYITALTGDATASGPGSAALTLATVNSNVGSFGLADSVGVFTVTAKGLITAASNLSIQIAESQVTNLVSDLAGKQPIGNYITALTGDVAASGPGSVAATIQAHAVSNSKLAQMVAHTYKGNNTGSTADPIDVTSTQLTADLNLFTDVLQGLTPSSGGGTSNFLRADGTWAAPPSNPGTVTSVAFSDASTSPIYSVSGSPVTSSGTLTITLATQTANKVFASATSGGAAQPAFRALVGADLPNPSSSTLGGVQSYAAVSNQFLTSISTSGVPASAQPAFSNISGTAAINQGGTGQTTASAAFNGLSPITTTGDLIYSSSGTTNSRLAIGSTGQVLQVAGGVPTWAAAPAPTAITENAQTGTTYTLALSDAGELVSLANSSPVAVTVPTNASVAFPVGTVIQLISAGAGSVYLSPAGGVTINSLNGVTLLSGEYAQVTLVKHATDTWYLYGGLASQQFIVATGGTITTSGNYKIHTFNSSGSFQILSGSGAVDSLVIAGGGGGGGNNGGGGGGAGGMIYTTPGSTLSAGTYTVTVGGGGAGGSGDPAVGTSGSNSQFNGMTAAVGGGGGGAHTPSGNGLNGGSGGGGGFVGAGATSSGGTGTGGQGNNGGTGSSSAGDVGGGGGGSGSAGSNGNSGGNVGGNGGTGTSNSITGSAVTYASGGGGGATTPGTASAGGGGSGATSGTATAGTANTGGGGGGCGNGSNLGTGGNGGSGIVILRYQYQ